ncbi:MAG: tRNA (adenosine(37)-N6)-dimethylallyltransferase MiaA, partial [Oscillospiraceae bacterium]|nr:tRNA (adenosine(37)-N6)-dimethylallyltransferase MiaA [Oscillospiraceae bacterium]
PHYFIQTESVTRMYTAGDYETDAIALLEKLFDQGHETLVMCGGTMFYIEAVCRGLDNFPDADPALRASLMHTWKTEGVEPLVEQLRSLDPATCEVIDLQNGQRVIRALEVCLMTGKPFSSFKTGVVKPRSFTIEKIGLDLPRETLYSRINARTDRMLSEGLVDEVRGLVRYRDLPALQTVGYQEVFPCLDGAYDLEEARRLIARNTRHYAKKQLSWWRGDPSIRWVAG